MQAIVLAAGYATRLFPLTRDFPKALLSVGGKPMLDHLVEKLDALEEISAIHVVSNHRFAGHFEAWAKGHRVRKIHVHDDGTSDDQTKLGAIGDIDFVLKVAGIDDDVLIAAGDNLLGIDIGAFVSRFYEIGRKTVILAQKIADLETLRRFGVAQTDESGKVIGFEEKPLNPKSDLGAFALYLYPKEALALLPEYFAGGNNPDAPGNLPAWLQKRAEVYAFVTDQPCFDIGTHESLRAVREIYGE
ncbi:MAG: nucleotidyltransferase family protein [Christensenellaceae bacterium]|jgi:glucose-1-phosphate thymidylyltransferase|nr:nucleotidyltransferase family protein [Christensenellaceae bacterium]